MNKSVLFVLFFLPLLVSAQDRQTRIIPAIFLISDTIVIYTTGMHNSDTLFHRPIEGSFDVQWIKGYLKQELHNTSEGTIDPGWAWCVDANGNRVSCYSDYWKTVQNLGEDKKPLRKGIVIWQIK